MRSMKCAYSTGEKHVHVPEEIAKAIEGLDITPSSRRKAQTDIVSYVDWVQSEKGDFPIVNTPDEHARLVDGYMAHLKAEGYARKTVEGRWTWVSRLYKELSMTLLNEYAFLEENPIEFLKEQTGRQKKYYLPDESEESQKKKQYYVDKETLELMCENATSPAFRNETLLRLMWTTGLRCSEVCELKLENINLDENLLEGFWVPKNTQSRTLWIPEKTVWLLDQYINGGYRDAFSYAEDSEYLFLTNKVPKMHRQTPNKVVKRTAKNAGIQEVIGKTQDGGDKYKVTAHALRRGHGMHLWKQGKDITLIRQRLGHHSVIQTEEYLPISIEESKEELVDVTF